MGVKTIISLPPFCIYFAIFNQTIVMNKKKPRLDLEALVHNKKEFNELPFLLQKKIFEFFRVSRIYNGKLKKIETLKEYRQALISEVVTGKIKVVKWAKN